MDNILFKFNQIYETAIQNARVNFNPNVSNTITKKHFERFYENG